MCIWRVCRCAPYGAPGDFLVLRLVRQAVAAMRLPSEDVRLSRGLSPPQGVS